MKSILNIIVGGVFFCTISASMKAEEMLWDNFQSGKKENYINKGAKAVEFVKEGDNTFALKIPSTKRRIFITSLKTPVKGGERYKFSFICKVDGPYTFEKNPQIEELMLMSNKDRKSSGVAPLPKWYIHFQDSNNKGVRRGYNQFYTCMLFSNKSYVEEFDVPLGSKTMTISFTNGNKDTSLCISDLKLTKIAKPKTLNINGDFSLGRYNYSGWNDNYKFACRIRENPEKSGAFQYDAHKGISFGDFISAEPGKKYNISYSFGSVVKNKIARLRIYFYSKNRKTKLLRPFVRIAKTSKGKSIEGAKTFVTPPKTVKMKIYLNGGIYDHIKITEFSDNKNNQSQ